MEKLKDALVMAAQVQKETLTVCTCLSEPVFISRFGSMSLPEKVRELRSVCLNLPVTPFVSMSLTEEDRHVRVPESLCV